MSERDEYLTPRDFFLAGLPVDLGLIPEVNGHPLGDSERFNYQCERIKSGDKPFNISPSHRFLVSRTYVQGLDGRRYRGGYTYGEKQIVDLVPDNSKKGMSKCLAVTDIYFSFRGRDNAVVLLSFGSGSIFWANKNGLEKIRDKEEFLLILGTSGSRKLFY